MLPMVSCLTPTYGRAPDFLHLLGEAVEAFVRQTYPADRRELLVLNDCPGQKLVCEAPSVRVVNLGRRLPSLGQKYDAMIGLARGSVLLCWEDDDVSLGHRIVQAVEHLGTDFAVFNPQHSWYLPGDDLHSDHRHGVLHNASAFTRDAWRAVGGYPAMSGAQDAVMDFRLKSLGRTAPPLSDDPREWSYVYCWGRSPVHLSGRADHETLWREVGSRPVAPGRFVIEPRFLRDYEGMCRAACPAAPGR